MLRVPRRGGDWAAGGPRVSPFRHSAPDPLCALRSLRSAVCALPWLALCLPWLCGFALALGAGRRRLEQSQYDRGISRCAADCTGMEDIGN